MDSMEWIETSKINLNAPVLTSQDLPSDEEKQSVTEEVKKEKKLVSLFG